MTKLIWMSMAAALVGCVISASARPGIESMVPTAMTVVVHVQPNGENVWVGCSIKKDGRIIDLDVQRIGGMGSRQVTFGASGASEARVSLWREKEKCGLFGKCPQCRESNQSYHMVDRLADTGWRPVGPRGVFGY